MPPNSRYWHQICPSPKLSYAKKSDFQAARSLFSANEFNLKLERFLSDFSEMSRVLLQNGVAARALSRRPSGGTAAFRTIARRFFARGQFFPQLFRDALFLFARLLQPLVLPALLARFESRRRSSK